MMLTAALVPVEQYLTTSYRPDCEYIDGVLLHRNLGELDHSRAQGLLYGYLLIREAEWNIFVVPEQRVQVKQRRFRVPDVCVVSGRRTEEQIFTTPPLLCVEILSKDDRMSEMQERIDDYFSMGVACAWVLNPQLKRGFVYVPGGMREALDGVLRVPNTAIELPLNAVFA